MRADDKMHDPNRLRKAIENNLTISMTRKKLIMLAMHGVFAEYKESEYKHMIGNLLKDGSFYSKSGKTRINDHEVLSPKTSFNGRRP
jgi:hypothetical protein